MAKLVLYGPDTKHGAIKRARYGRYVWHIVGKEKDEAGKWHDPDGRDGRYTCATNETAKDCAASVNKRRI